MYFWGGDIAQEPSWKLRRKRAEVLAVGGAKIVEAAFAAADDVDGFFAATGANEKFWTDGWGGFASIGFFS